MPHPRSPTTIAKVIAGLALVALALAFGPHLYLAFIHRRTVLATGLPRVAREADLEFDRRVKARFPLGSSALAMERELGEQGFGAAHDHRSSRYVRLDRSAGLLEESLSITWDNDGGDRLTAVRGTYGLTGP